MPSIGIKLAPQNCTIEDLRAVWRIADEAGFDHLWAFDHFNPIFSDVAGDVFEGMTLLAAMAEATAAMVDLLHAYTEAGFTENIIYVPPGGDPVRAAEIAAERVLPEILGGRR